VLAGRLEDYANRSDVLVLALPRGGVPVGFGIATELNAPLDVFLVRKLGLPRHEDVAIGAIASGGIRVLNPDVVGPFGVTDQVIDTVTAREQRVLERLERLYRDGHPAAEIRDHTVIFVDDGVATGSTMHAGVQALRRVGPARLVIAVPTALPEQCEQLGREADEIVCAITPSYFRAAGQLYEDFSHTTDEEVADLLALNAIRQRASMVAR
jgi:predicted phosphoribosyltransferase